jgi:predicted membrane protein
MKIKNPKVFFLSLLAIGFVLLGIFIDWLFLIGAVAIMVYNQREMNKDNKKKLLRKIND